MKDIKFDTYIIKLSKLHTKLKPTANAIDKLNSLINIIGDKLIESAINATGKLKTLNSTHFNGITEILVQGELGKHARVEGAKAVYNYQTESSDRPTGSSKAQKAGLIFPPALFDKMIRNYIKSKGYDKRVAKNAPIFLAGVMEYLIAELVEASGNSKEQDYINEQHIAYAIVSDPEYDNMIRNFDIKIFDVQEARQKIRHLKEERIRDFSSTLQAIAHRETPPEKSPPSKKKKSTKAKGTKAKSTKAKSTKAKSTKAKSTKAKSTKAKAKSTKAKSTKAKSTKAKTTKAKSTKVKSTKVKSTKVCPSSKILNPKTGRCVLKSGKIGQSILKGR